MPIPENNTAWPPKQIRPMLDKWEEWSGWYTNDLDSLAEVYSGEHRNAPPTAANQGIIRTAAKAARRFFWGEKRTDLTRPPERKLHVPVAADLCQASSDLLFSEPPEVSLDIEDEQKETLQTTSDRLAELTGPDFHKALAQGAEVAAALGGCYLRVTWDSEILDRPFLTVVDYDNAVPEFRWGRLTAVTFWQVVQVEGQQYWRHLERHATDEQGIGIIEHGLFQGTEWNLGHAVPLTEADETAELANLVDANSSISTGSEGLDVFHWENLTPQRTWRSHHLGRNLGRSDLDGLEPLLDALDEAYTSLMRDVRLGKAMLVVPESMLTNNAPGRGATFDHSEIYSPVNVAPGTVADNRMNVEQVQFSIRIGEHEQTIAALWQAIIRSAGYSAQTFGDADSNTGGAQTATEVAARERRSGLTQSRKARTVLPVLEQVVRKLLDMDAVIFSSGVDTSVPLTVSLQDGVKEDMQTLANTAQMLSAALAASIETRVRLVHPDWSNEEVDREVERIKDENSISLEEPEQTGRGGFNLPNIFESGTDEEDDQVDTGETDLEDEDVTD